MLIPCWPQNFRDFAYNTLFTLSQTGVKNSQIVKHYKGILFFSLQRFEKFIVMEVIIISNTLLTVRTNTCSNGIRRQWKIKLYMKWTIEDWKLDQAVSIKKSVSPHIIRAYLMDYASLLPMVLKSIKATANHKNPRTSYFHR